MNNPNFIKNLEIENYKSINQLQIDCKRVNLFIGEPNVGKSNILEAISTVGDLSHSNTDYHKDGMKLNNNVLRFEKIKNLFFDNNFERQILVKSDRLFTIISKEYNRYIFFTGKMEILTKVLESPYYQLSIYAKEALDASDYYYYFVNEEGDVLDDKFTTENEPDSYGSLYFNEAYHHYVKTYYFDNLNKQYNSDFIDDEEFLNYPNGNNLFETAINHNILQDVSNKFTKNGLDIVYDTEQNKIVVQKKKGLYIYQFPFSSIADTFQRLIFYLTAIESNKNSVIVFEEPEVHSFPPYVVEIAQKIIDKKDNQFFISTHSPYMFNQLIDNLDYSELNVSVVYYRDNKTQINTLTDKELRHASDIGTDIFFNLDRYVNL